MKVFAIMEPGTRPADMSFNNKHGKNRPVRARPDAHGIFNAPGRSVPGSVAWQYNRIEFVLDVCVFI